MATDFFDRQAAARRSTAWLLAMFAIAVLTTASSVFVLVLILVSSQEGSPDGTSRLTVEELPWQVPAGAAAGTLAVILAGSLFKVAMLRTGGGRSVAEGLGGRRLLHDTVASPAERRLLNVVDEMAIASGTPSPPVFLMDDPAINAFAAGYSPSDAVVGVTRGCVEQLTREELQGVIAHEFSHILNGDMRMSIRLIGVLHGILLLGLIGRLVLRTVFHTGAVYDSRRSNTESGKGGAGVLAVLGVGVALLVIGSIGSLMGGMIKAAVSRQREFLADASAVQFTRNPGGIAGALKRILGAAKGSQLNHPRAAELSHMYFAQGIWEGFTSWMATHPPLPVRIRAIEPAWDGVFEPSDRSTSDKQSDGAVGFAGQSTASSEVSIAALDAAIDRIGDPFDGHRRYATELIESIPARVRAAAGEPCGARAVVYGLLLDSDPEVRATQYAALRETADSAVVDLLAERLEEPIDQLEARTRLPLIDMTLPSLAAMSFPQYQRFSRSFRALVVADERLSLFEWTLSQVLLRNLRPQFERVRSPRVKYRSLAPLNQECGVLLSVMAHACGDANEAPAAYRGGQRLLDEAPIDLLGKEACTLDALRDALEKLAAVDARRRGRVVEAAAAVVSSDQRVTVAEAELLRGIADLLDCPMPPLLPGQTIVS